MIKDNVLENVHTSQITETNSKIYFYIYISNSLTYIV